MNELNQTLQLLGLTLPSPAFIVISTIFNVIGVLAYLRGKRRHLPIFKWLGVALMVYPIFVSDTWAMAVVGTALCAGLYVYRE